MFTPVDDEAVEANEWLDVEYNIFTEASYSLVGDESLTHSAAIKILDNEWRFVNPGEEYFSIDSDGTWEGEYQNIASETGVFIYSGIFPIGQ